MKEIILYHSADLDGHCSGAICKSKFKDAELYGIDYGEEVPWGKIKGKKVVMVDFSMQPWSNMQKLDELAEEIIWIDHHKSAIDEYNTNKSSLTKQWQTTLDTNFAACELCWNTFYEDEMPHMVYLLGRYDIWQIDATEDVMPFQMGMRLEKTDPATNFNIWTDHILDHRGIGFFDNVVNNGKVVINYQKQQDEKLMKPSFEINLENLNFLVVNAAFINSITFNSKFDPKKHDAVMSFYYNGPSNKYKISMYSPDQRTPLSEIAKRNGGGGHPFACGFEQDNIDFILNNRK